MVEGRRKNLHRSFTNSTLHSLFFVVFLVCVCGRMLEKLADVFPRSRMRRHTLASPALPCCCTGFWDAIGRHEPKARAFVNVSVAVLRVA